MLGQLRFSDRASSWAGLEHLESRLLLAAGDIEAVASFTPAIGRPTAGLVIDVNDNIYGVSRDGGAFGEGSIFELTAGADAIARLASFNGDNGSHPEGRLLLDGAGNLFGVTSAGGEADDGTVFKVGGRNHAISTLASFTDWVFIQDGYWQHVIDGYWQHVEDGYYEYIEDGYWEWVESGYWGLVEDGYWEWAESGFWDWVDDGYWGLDDYGEWIYVDAGYWEYFDTSDWEYVDCSYWEYFDTSGWEYVDTGYWEYCDASYDVYIDTSYDYYVDTSYWARTGMGTGPAAGLTFDRQGRLVGTTRRGGDDDSGTVFSVDPSGGKIDTLASFGDGSGPVAGLVMDASGNLYGTSPGNLPDGSDGYIYKLRPGDDEIIIVAGLDGCGSDNLPGLIIDDDGNLFGVTPYGGDYGQGSIFTLPHGSHAVITLYSFSGADGRNPAGELTSDLEGNLFGVTARGGENDDGVVFELPDDGGEFKILAYLDEATTGGRPVGPMVFDSHGDLFGIATTGGDYDYGAIFRLTVESGPALKLAFVRQPTDLLLGQPGQPIIVEILDAMGRRAAADNSPVTLTLCTASGLPAGAVTVNAVNGVATFQDLPLSAVGRYKLVASDNSLVPAATGLFSVDSIDLMAVLGRNTLPAAVVAGSPMKGKLSVAIANSGTLPLPAGQKVDIQFIARYAADPAGGEIVLTTLHGKSVSRLRPGASVTFTASVNRPGGLPLGQYQIVARIVPVQPLAESTTLNNTALTMAIGGSWTIAAAAPFFDVAATMAAPLSLPTYATAGRKLAGRACVQLVNLGNMALATGQKLDIQFVARNTATPDGPDIVLASLAGRSLGGMRPGALKRFSASLQLPSDMPAGDYEVIAVITLAGLAESNIVNNVASLTGLAGLLRVG